jgi:hypothetical protein
MMDTEMRFICVKTIKISPRMNEVEAFFMPQKPFTPPKMSVN